MARTKTVKREHEAIAFHGFEPTFENAGVLNGVETGHAYNWYSSSQSYPEAKKYLVDFLAEHGRVDEANRLKTVPDWAVSPTAGWIVRMQSRGAKFVADKSEFVNGKIKEALKHAAPLNVEKRRKTTVQDHIREKVAEVIGIVDDAMDAHNTKFSLIDYFKEHGTANVVIKRVKDHFTPILAEYKEALEGKDAQLSEGYATAIKSGKLKKDYANLKRMLADSTEYTVVNPVRRNRKKKAMTPERKLKFFFPKKEDAALKIKSVERHKVLGASEAWLVNTRYGIVTVLRAANERGLDVYRTAVTNYDEKASMSKRSGRKLEFVIDKVLNGGKVARKKALDSVNAQPIEIKDRVSDDVILLAVYK
jgi:hypothetical protein